MPLDERLASFRKHFPPGHVLVREGEEGNGFYIVEHGELTVQKGGKRVASFSVTDSVEFVGEVAALLETPRIATVVCKSAVVALYIETTDFEALIARSPSLGVKLARSLAKKVNASPAEILKQSA